MTENLSPASTFYSYISGSAGIISSGALINVTSVPFTLSLTNRSGTTKNIAEDYTGTSSTATMRVFKFANGPSI